MPDNVVINAMDKKTLLLFLERHDPIFRCCFCNAVIDRISKIGGIKKTSGTLLLICTKTECNHKTWSKATHLE